MESPLFVVNPASGGGFGHRLAAGLRARWPGRVRMLGDPQALPAAAAQARAESAPLIACGGDGTVAAALEAGRSVGGIEVGLIPLGTGNDLARVLGYPASAASWGAADDILARLPRARAIDLDRWTLSGPAGGHAWYNYASWGFDARIAWQFHRLRRRHGRVLRWRAVNQACYAAIGLPERAIDLGLTLDDARGARRVPTWTRSLVLANIPSYAGGRRLGRFVRGDDGRCDAFALAGGLAFGLGLSGWRLPLRLGVFGRLTVRLARPGFLQLDGEPLAAPAGTYAVAHGGVARLLALPPRDV